MPKSFPIRSLVNILAVIGAFYVIVMFSFYLFGKECSSEVTGLVISPNGKMQAKMTNSNCVLEKEEVQIIIGERQTNTGLVIFESEVNTDAPIHIVWDGDSRLRVNYPWGMQPRDNRSFHYEGVDISIHTYDP